MCYKILRNNTILICSWRYLQVIDLNVTLPQHNIVWITLKNSSSSRIIYLGGPGCIVLDRLFFKAVKMSGIIILKWRPDLNEALELNYMRKF